LISCARSFVAASRRSVSAELSEFGEGEKETDDAKADGGVSDVVYALVKKINT
jgi:hypothetical protein